jgi:DNA polymerase-3 subunit epsilon
MYAIVDIETTGGSPLYEKITEIAIFVHDGEKIIDEFTTLINPEKTIPYYITGMTGITNEMVADAPKFYEVAKKIIELTENKTFVAHNVNFDYNFIKSEFRNLGYNFQREQLCTVKLSRKLIPGHRSYSLGNICGALGIEINGRHRAAGDALATTKLFEILIGIKKLQSVNGFEKEDRGVLHPSLDNEKINKLPDEPGVYYLYNDKNDIIYIGKSKNIKARVLSHLGPSRSKTAIKMRQEIADVAYELTGSELVALLLESSEIKAHKPLFNRMQRRSLSHYAIAYYRDENGYACFEVTETNKNNNEILRAFDNREEARHSLVKLCEEYALCQKLCNLYQSQGTCFHYEIRLCKGACAGIEPVDEYNSRAEMAKTAMGRNNENIIIIDKGRSNNEKSIVRLKDGKYLGFGYIDVSEITSVEMLKDCVTMKRDNHEVWMIIKNYLKKNKVERVLNA